MKKRYLGFPLLWYLIITLIVTSGALAYQIFSGRVEVTVQEPISKVGTWEFTDDLYPKQSKAYTVTAANASPTDSFDLTILYTISPDITGKDITVSVPNKITVPAGGQASGDITVTLGKSAVPGKYTITFSPDR